LDHIGRRKDDIDVVCLQEVFEVPIVSTLTFHHGGSYAAYFRKGLMERGFPFVAVSPPSESFWVQNSGLVIASKIPFQSTDHLWYSVSESTTAKGALRVTLLFPAVDAQQGQRTLPVSVVTTHLNSDPEDDKRLLQLSELDDWLTTNETEARQPCILAGDLNQESFNGTWPMDSPLHWRTAYNKPREELEPTFPEEHTLLDHVYYTPSPSGVALSPEIADSERNATVKVHKWTYNAMCCDGGELVSDHHAIYATMRVVSSVL
jgi:endonuclease/exonuclease/phosphatase family metal-dependent hydrolase